MVSIEKTIAMKDDSPRTCKLGADDVIVVLGAGASVEAGLLSSDAMTRRLEECISSADGKMAMKWGRYKKLYRAVKSAILYGHHLTSAKGGARVDDVNIEELVNVLTELAKAESHTIYPFIAAWNMELTKHGGADFANLKEFRRDIVNELVGSWVNVKNVEDCQYYKNFLKYWEATRYSLRIFSLNYDMCVERACGIDLITAHIRAALGMTVPFMQDPVYHGAWAEVILHGGQDGVFRRVQIAPELQPYVAEQNIWVHPGDVVHRFTGANAAIGTLVLKFPSAELSDAYMKKLRDVITVIIE